MKRGRFFSFVIGLLLLSVGFGAGCTRGLDSATAAAAKRIDLNIWAVVDDDDVYGSILQAYRTLHPNVNIDFRRFRLEEYEAELLNAMAEDRGPDVFLIHNTWVSKYQPKIAPMPATTKVAFQRLVGTVKKEVTYVLEDERMITMRKYKEDYPEAVVKDTVRVLDTSTDSKTRRLEEKILAIPMSVDTLAMFVNKDLLNAAGIATIPATWDKFQEAVPRLVKQDAQGNIIQAAAALGTAYNVERMPDIVSVLMMQNGAEMVSDDGYPTFSSIPAGLSGQRAESPAHQALAFYIDFANPAKTVYTWNDKQPNSLDAFIQGKAAFFFGYSYNLPTIRARAPKLNLGLAQLPQIEGNPVVNYANYWAWTVSKRSKNTEMAWNLLNFMTKPEQVTKYLTAANRPAAIKSLLTEQLEDEELGVFAAQVLTSKSWYRGKDPQAMENAFSAMVENTLSGAEEIPKAVRDAQSIVAQTM